MSNENPTPSSRYSIGIDLGTTNSVLSYVDLHDSEDENIVQEVLLIPQLTSPGAVDEKTQLPSFIYQAHPDELSESDTVLPWASNPTANVGFLARELGTKTPIRLVSSAKSWLCHSGVDCRAPILPIEAPKEIDRISPLQASIYFLEHLRDAWNYKHPDTPIETQQLTITVPASFDPAARELTVEAARSVGMNQAILLEEPQSALYSWIQRSHGDWRDHVSIGDIILVVDVGGGTTDLSLIAVTADQGNLVLNRVAVGDHILLGGDNMDLALAYVVKAKVEANGQMLEPWQIQGLTHGCRDAKEAMLSDPTVEQVPIVVPSRGSKLIGGTLRTELTRAEINQTLVEGFLPKAEASERPFSQPRTGLTTIALPYAQDPGITRHLAIFLNRQLSATSELEGFDLPETSSFLHPTAVLLNGGVFKADALTNRLMDVLNGWLKAEQAPAARLLEGADLDLSVARGAAYYGYVRQGGGVRIRGGTAASYYIGVESAMPAVPGMPPPLQAVCVAPFGIEEGTQQELPPHEFGLVVGEPVRFRFFGSTVRREDNVGTRLDHWMPDEIEELDEIEITLAEEARDPGEVVPVQLGAAVTEVGTLQLEAIAKEGGQRWKIEFDVRAGEERDSSAEESGKSTQNIPIENQTSLGTNDENTDGRDDSETSTDDIDAPESSESGKKSGFWGFNK